MALSQKPLDQDRDLLAALYDVILNTIGGHSPLQLSDLHILEIAVKHVHKTATHPSDWLERGPFGLIVNNTPRRSVMGVDHWVWLHLETILAPKHYLLPEEVKNLNWSDSPEKVHIAKARLDLYDSLANADHEVAHRSKPDPELLRVFLWSKDSKVCSRAFRWSLQLVPISQQHGTLRDGDNTGMFVPETMGYEWVEHFVHVLCQGGLLGHLMSWELLESHLVPKWDMLPSSWCCDFASSFLFSIGHPLDIHGLPAYQSLAKSISFMQHEVEQEYLPFLANMLQLVQSSLTWARLTSLESWLASIPESLNSQDAHTRMDCILATRKQELVEETLGCFAELPMADLWMDE